MKQLGLLGILLAVVLTACGSNDSTARSLADELPLDGEQPTFVFFYTDG